MLLVFRGKGKAKEFVELKARKDVTVTSSPSGWANDEVISFWINANFNTAVTMTKKHLLIWDSFRGHISEQTKSLLRKKRINSAVLPGGTTGILQAADVSWNKPFKANMVKQYDEWLENGKK